MQCVYVLLVEREWLFVAGVVAASVLLVLVCSSVGREESEKVLAVCTRILSEAAAKAPIAGGGYPRGVVPISWRSPVLGMGRGETIKGHFPKNGPGTGSGMIDEPTLSRLLADAV